jgi:hypothetical protein
MRLIVWTLNHETEQIDIGDDVFDDGSVERFSITRLNDNRVFVAAQMADDTLRMTSWRIDGSGTISRQSVSTGGAITTVAAATVMQQASLPFPGNTPSEWQVVVAVGVDSQGGRLKLIPCVVDDATGAITRIGGSTGGTSASIDVSEVALAIPPRPFGTIVTASRVAGSSLLHVMTWTMDATTGGITARNSVSGGAVEAVAATGFSDGRIGVVTQNDDDGQVVSTWDVTGSGSTLSPVLHDSRAWGGAQGPVAIVNGGGSRLYSLNAGALWSWDAIDEVEPVDFVSPLADMTGSASLSVALVSPDRPIAVFSDAQGTLKIAAFKDLHVPLLHGEWPRAGLGDSLDPPAPEDIPGMAPVDVPELSPPNEAQPEDLALAVGRQAVIVYDGNNIAFYDRAGSRLPPKYLEPGSTEDTIDTELYVKDLFADVVDEVEADGATTNEQSLQRHLRDQWRCDPDQLPKNVGTNDCTWSSFYDGRVVYNDTLRRFFIMSPVKRNSNTGNERYHGIAVSKTEDPRDGFYVYMTTESKQGDEPRFSVANQMLLLGRGRDMDYRLAPALHVYQAEHLANPIVSGNYRRVATSKISVFDVGNNWVRTPAQYGSESVAIVYRSDYSDTVRLYAVKHPWQPPDFPSGGIRVSATVPSSNIVVTLPSSLTSVDDFFTADSVVTMRPAVGGSGFTGSFLWPGKKPAANTSENDVGFGRIRFAIDSASSANISSLGSSLHVMTCPGRGQGEAIDCDFPAVAEKGDRILLSYVRKTPQGMGLLPNAEYELLNTSNLSQVDTGILKEGLSWPSNLSEVDTTAAAPDPIDGTLWTLQVYGGSSGASPEVVLGRVEP